MSKNEQFDGETTEVNSGNRPPKKNKLGKVFLVALCAGVIGGGAVVGGYSLYQNYSGSDAQGTASTSNISVNVSTQTTKAFNKVKNAVVSVEAYTESDSSSSLEDLFGQSSDSSESSQTSTSEGSGVIYKKSGNYAYIVTNNHVISGANKVEILLASGKKLSATVVGTDSVTDLAVLKIKATDVKQVATFGNSDNIKVGETALAIGSPLGSDYATSLTQGIISAKSRTIDVTDSNGVTTGQATVIQTDAAINPGNSGGPLVNLQGQVIGINSMKLSSTGSSSSSSSTTVEGMGFAIPSNEVVTIINQLVKNGKVVRPALGISLVDLSYVSESARTSTLKLPSSVTSGVVVMKVESNSPLADSGISKYDVITSLGGTKVTSLATLRQALYKHKIGDTVEIEYYHEGTKKTASVKLTLEADDSNTTTSSNSESSSAE
ncbi:S1C family serine protease [Ligilactobacillus apodemi]|uniref:Endopeptidase n=1 Tax=Ligilactobacillus apodemi DSM 16634 = JCM 16172 TaxID=1423724 RepID=A0A0R1TZF0_9LACO|nr:trypsin-like peptidase domain-containing protein [Ligilactobacillus apodemi]KRL86585.1 endopeptidase [Ligilactobacillus apodemi DSM 16634 = JCM 16172]MCR1901716.1 trypsin-like peptidase domain-containing protein [Ligilactobacillus apodemi]